jgi:hypothetical protein
LDALQFVIQRVQFFRSIKCAAKFHHTPPFMAR